MTILIILYMKKHGCAQSFSVWNQPIKYWFSNLNLKGKKMRKIRSWGCVLAHVYYHAVHNRYNQNMLIQYPNNICTVMHTSPFFFSLWFQLKRYYQPRKSHRSFSLILHGEKVPLYGAGASLSLSSTDSALVSAVPLTLDFELRSRGYVIGKLVKVSHKQHFGCSLTVDYRKSKPIKFSRSSCSFDWAVCISSRV